jgi:hypothetical protein
LVKKLAIGMALLILLTLLLFHAGASGWLGRHEGPGEVTRVRRAESETVRSVAAIQEAATKLDVAESKQILFGDLHVHTTVSYDAFLTSLPLLNGEGSHTQADACDYARFCSALDFWSINDHAGAITPDAWRETVDSIRACNDVAGDPTNPDTVAFLGWEWTQMGTSPENHWGHRNVVLRDLEDGRIPTRPIAASGGLGASGAASTGWLERGGIALLGGDPRYRDFSRYLVERRAMNACPDGVPVRDLSADCSESVATPAELFAKLDEWDLASIVIPHGTTWGLYTPAGSTWDKQLVGAAYDPKRQLLLESYSGHGNSEVYRDWRALERGPDGEWRCPEPTPDYLPQCWQAGEIVRGRCEREGLDAGECDQRARLARENVVKNGALGHLSVPDYDPAEWLDAGQCRDCDQPAFNYRPGNSAQYILAIRNFDDPSSPRSFRMGLMGSSDDHAGKAGTGFKERLRTVMTDSSNLNPADRLSATMTPKKEAPEATSRIVEDTGAALGFARTEFERQGSFFLTGGLVAVHATSRDRGSIWDALKRREVYGTTGPRILLWFDLLNAPPMSSGEVERRLPMGSETPMRANPRFSVRAAGSFEQKPGCPDHATTSLSPERLAHVCRGECYFPSEERRLISRIEIVRIRPQATPDEPVGRLIEDPWRVFECEPDRDGCAVTFTDPDFAAAGRDTVYYARAIEMPTPGINAGGFRCDRDSEGACIATHLCGTTGQEDDCLAEHEPRAWSSPLFLDWAGDERSPAPLAQTTRRIADQAAYIHDAFIGGRAEAP